MENWRIRYEDPLRAWGEEKERYRIEREALERKKDKLENEKAMIEGAFAKQRIAAKEKEIMGIRIKISQLRVPEMPEIETQPKEPMEPVLRDEPVLLLEQRIGKEEVLSVLQDFL